MTTKTYLAQPTLLEGLASITVIGHDADGRSWVRLSHTLFHPQGGGQKADRGKVGGHDVTHVAHSPDRLDVAHFLAVAQSLRVGQEVPVVVDGAWRMENARLHTAGHLIASLVEWAYPHVRAVGGHHWPGEGRVEFEGEFPDAVKLSALLNVALRQAVEEDLPVRIVGDPFTSRTIQIGDFGAIACGGTHLQSLRALGSVEVGEIKVKRGQLRIRYSLGE